MSAMSKHPKEHLIHDDCHIEIHPHYGDDGLNNGYNILVIDSHSESVVADDWEPDFDWAWETAKYFSRKYTLEVLDLSPY